MRQGDECGLLLLGESALLQQREHLGVVQPPRCRRRELCRRRGQPRRWDGRRSRGLGCSRRHRHGRRRRARATGGGRALRRGPEQSRELLPLHAIRLRLGRNMRKQRLQQRLGSVLLRVCCYGGRSVRRPRRTAPGGRRRPRLGCADKRLWRIHRGGRGPGREQGQGVGRGCRCRCRRGGRNCRGLEIQPGLFAPR